jgi:putative tricarboxylic transport membrane protein
LLQARSRWTLRGKCGRQPPVIATFALQFGPAEFLTVYLLTFCSFVGMGKESPFKIIASMMIGFALAAVGLDTVTGQCA